LTESDVAGLTYCTFADTDAVPFIVNVQVCRLFPPLEHAPDQIASRPFDTLSVIEVPVVNEADPEPPTATLMPAGLEVTRSPLLPVAVTVRVTAAPGGGGADAGFTVSTAVRATAANVAEMVADVEVVTDVVVTVKVALVAPAGTVTLAGTEAALELSESDTAAPPAGAAALSDTVPVDALPPTTLVGFSDTADSVGLVAPPDGLIVSVALFVTFS
jgi:hypothetical protein